MQRFTRLADVWRGDVLESRHWGIAAVSNARGEVIAGWGDVDLVTYPRSSMKPFQALPLVETGAADAFGLTERHLALACASHRGEVHHTRLAGAWLKQTGFAIGDLACGPEYPKHLTTQHAMIARGEAPSSLHHNCSGKHAGFLSVCRHCGHDPMGYDQMEHPTQQAYAGLLNDLGTRVTGWGIDGCTLPTPALSLADAARIGALMSAAKGPHGPAMRRVVDAMRACPEYTSGSDHAMVAVTKATRGRVTFKVGAEAFLLAFLPEDGLGVAIKVADGNSRARVPALLAILQGLGVMDKRAVADLQHWIEPQVRDSRGHVVGALKPSAGLSKPRETAPA
ncbi:asparaginase [Thalassococcus sp. S3]|uniref:asparaginase n=1 Tax=Thalassococcus sp. S3 TaxID=2017482 RepID=UPI0013EEE8D5|nr:asparaginase [Thalassococcus sp. S3]